MAEAKKFEAKCTACKKEATDCKCERQFIVLSYECGHTCGDSTYGPEIKVNTLCFNCFMHKELGK